MSLTQKCLQSLKLFSKCLELRLYKRSLHLKNRKLGSCVHWVLNGSYVANDKLMWSIKTAFPRVTLKETVH